MTFPRTSSAHITKEFTSPISNDNDQKIDIPVFNNFRSSKSARDFVNFYKKIKSKGDGVVDNADILKFSKLFEDSITLGKNGSKNSSNKF